MRSFVISAASLGGVPFLGRALTGQCYLLGDFFSKREGARVKYVTYHFVEEPELHTEAAETNAFSRSC